MESQERGSDSRNGDRWDLERFMIEPDGGRGFNGGGKKQGKKPGLGAVTFIASGPVLAFTAPPMLKHSLNHPKINEVLGRAGHHAKILIADGNYPASTTLGPNAELVSLNLSPGVVNCVDVLKAVLSAIPIDIVNTMGIPADDPYAKSGDPPIWKTYREVLDEHGVTAPLTPIPKWDFYNAVASREHVLTIQTAEQALWANILLSVGVRKVGE